MIFLGYISKFVKDLEYIVNFENFLQEVKIYTRTKLSRGKIRTTFPIFKVDKNNIISFDDSDNLLYIFYNATIY